MDMAGLAVDLRRLMQDCEILRRRLRSPLPAAFWVGAGDPGVARRDDIAPDAEFTAWRSFGGFTTAWSAGPPPAGVSPGRTPPPIWPVADFHLWNGPRDVEDARSGFAGVYLGTVLPGAVAECSSLFSRCGLTLTRLPPAAGVMLWWRRHVALWPLMPDEPGFRPDPREEVMFQTDPQTLNNWTAEGQTAVTDWACALCELGWAGVGGLPNDGPLRPLVPSGEFRGGVRRLDWRARGFRDERLPGPIPPRELPDREVDGRPVERWWFVRFPDVLSATTAGLAHLHRYVSGEWSEPLAKSDVATKVFGYEATETLRVKIRDGEVSAWPIDRRTVRLSLAALTPDQRREVKALQAAAAARRERKNRRQSQKHSPQG